MAVQIARIEDNTICIDVEGFGSILEKVAALPVAIVAISGPLQEGKCHIANNLLRYLAPNVDSGEEWPSDESLAHRSNEILMWPEPLLTTNNDLIVAVLVTLVLGSPDDTLTMESALIHSFGCLLGSVMIYNVQQEFPEEALNFLHMMLVNAKDVIDYSAAKLLLVVNDWDCPEQFGHGYHEDHGAPSARNFKKERLDLRATMALENRVVHQGILDSFAEFSCCLVPSRGFLRTHTEQLGNPLEVVAHWVFRGGPYISKAVGEQEVTGSDLKKMVVEWSALYSNGKIPVFGSAAEATDEVRHAMASSVALQFYRGEMTNTINGHEFLLDEQLRKIHACKKQDAAAILERIGQTKNSDVQLNEQLDGLFRSFLQMNMAKRCRLQEQQAAEQDIVQDARQRLDLGESQHQIHCSCTCSTIVFCIKLIIVVSILMYVYVLRPTSD